uniref:Uncharacterized protein n=1 Tax=Ascaris lumbricoides TaxID=6252 RepID=A0A0M3HMN8_ASCLU
MLTLVRVPEKVPSGGLRLVPRDLGHCKSPNFGAQNAYASTSPPKNFLVSPDDDSRLPEFCALQILDRRQELKCRHISRCLRLIKLCVPSRD